MHVKHFEHEHREGYSIDPFFPEDGEPTEEWFPQPFINIYASRSSGQDRFWEQPIISWSSATVASSHETQQFAEGLKKAYELAIHMEHRHFEANLISAAARVEEVAEAHTSTEAEKEAWLKGESDG